MTPRDDVVRLRHLREAAEKAIGFSAGAPRGPVMWVPVSTFGIATAVREPRSSVSTPGA